MAEGRNQVKDVQKHLRRAGELIAHQQFAAALIEIDAALAIDRGSLAALTLRQRIVQAPMHTPAASPPERSAGESDRRPPPVAPAAANTRFVPPGVDAQSWLGFEQRIQERRFRALLQTINTAIATDDGIAARIALEEARELRPGAPELEAVADRIALLPMALPGAESGGYLRSRASGAVALLLAGVALLIGLERVRSDDPIRAPRSITEPDNRRLSNPDPIPSDPSAAPVAAVPDLVPSPALVAAPEPSATTGTVPSSTDEPAPPSPGPVNRSADVVDARAASNEIPDDLVTERPRREADAPVRAASVESGAAATRPRSVPSATPASTPPATAPASPPGTAASSSLARSAPPTAAVPPAASANTTDTSEAGATTPISQRPGSSQADSTLAASRPAGTQATQSGSSDIVAASAVAGELVPPSVSPSSAVVTIPDETGGVAQVLDQYARAYTQLDARAARAIWPSVDERGLARAFGQLESQAVSFDDCEISVRGARADASCHGHTSFVGKVGSREERTEARSWRFQLRRDGEAWMIQSAEAR